MCSAHSAHSFKVRLPLALPYSEQVRGLPLALLEEDPEPLLSRIVTFVIAVLNRCYGRREAQSIGSKMISRD